MAESKLINKIFFDKYLCQSKIGKGSFGTVYEGINTKTYEKIAFKLERKEKGKSSTLEPEAYRLLYLQGEGIPKIYCYGNNSTHNVLIQELLGDNLETLYNKNNQKFSLKTICVLGMEMIKRIQFVHSKHHIHRDIKPENFTIGRGKNANKIYIIDFGLSKKYFSDRKQKHIKFCKGKSLTGTARYCSRHAHMGYEQSRRDDIESIGYVLMYFLLGKLPWQGLKIHNDEDHFTVIANKKINTPFEELCKGQPEEFLAYFQYVDGLEFEEEPKYDYIISLFQEMINKYCANCNYDFDWNKKECNYLPTNIIEDKANKSRDISLFVNKNNNNSLSNESTSKGITDNKEVFINEENVNEYSFDLGELNKNNHNNNPEKEEDNNRHNRHNSREEEKQKNKSLEGRRNKRNTNRCKSVPKNYKSENLHDNLGNNHKEENNVEKNIKANNIPDNNIVEKDNNIKDDYNNLSENKKEDETTNNISESKNRRKRYSSDDFTNKRNNDDKEDTKCGCFIF